MARGRPDVETRSSMGAHTPRSCASVHSDPDDSEQAAGPRAGPLRGADVKTCTAEQAEDDRAQERVPRGFARETLSLAVSAPPAPRVCGLGPLRDLSGILLGAPSPRDFALWDSHVASGMLLTAGATSACRQREAEQWSGRWMEKAEDDRAAGIPWARAVGVDMRTATARIAVESHRPSLSGGAPQRAGVFSAFAIRSRPMHQHMTTQSHKGAVETTTDTCPRLEGLILE